MHLREGPSWCGGHTFAMLVEHVHSALFTFEIWLTRPPLSIETWALEEAKRRLQAEGTLPEDE